MTELAENISELNKKSQGDLASNLVIAARASGRNPVALALDFMKLRRRPGKLKFYEYVQYGLYDKTRWSEEQRDTFVSAHQQWPMVHPCNNKSWFAVTEDKWLSATLLQQAGIPVPDLRAVFDRGVRSYGDAVRLRNAQDLKAFLQSVENFPLFAKPVAGAWSAGALRISGITETHVLIDGKKPTAFDDLADQLIGDVAYLIQDCLVPHAIFDGITDATATVRSVNMIRSGGVDVSHTLLKLPMRGNVADNFWRPGNVLCTLDVETGEVKNIVMVKNGQRVELDELPGLDRTFIGEQMPHWQELREVNKKVALMHAENRFQSTDIAITKDGPVVVEVNYGCAFELMQIATGQGFMTADIAGFFRDCGAPI